MVLTSRQKFLLITSAILIGAFGLIWTGIKVDVLALGMNEHVFNIGQTVSTVLNTTIIGVLTYLGLKAPTAPKEDDDAP